jgi:hypothetical protein
MSKEVVVFTKQEHFKRKSMSINRQKMKKLISGEADALVHRAMSLDGEIIQIYRDQELKNLLAAAVMNGRSLPNDKGQMEVEYFLAPFIDPNGVVKNLDISDEKVMETDFDGNPFNFGGRTL